MTLFDDLPRPKLAKKSPQDHLSSICSALLQAMKHPRWTLFLTACGADPGGPMFEKNSNAQYYGSWLRFSHRRASRWPCRCDCHRLGLLCRARDRRRECSPMQELSIGRSWQVCPCVVTDEVCGCVCRDPSIVACLATGADPTPAPLSRPPLIRPPGRRPWPWRKRTPPATHDLSCATSGNVWRAMLAPMCARSVPRGIRLCHLKSQALGGLGSPGKRKGGNRPQHVIRCGAMLLLQRGSRSPLVRRFYSASQRDQTHETFCNPSACHERWLRLPRLGSALGGQHLEARGRAPHGVVAALEDARYRPGVGAVLEDRLDHGGGRARPRRRRSRKWRLDRRPGAAAGWPPALPQQSAQKRHRWFTCRCLRGGATSDCCRSCSGSGSER